MTVMSTGIDAIRRKSNPIRFLSLKHKIPYDTALNFADQFMERHAGVLNRHHLDAIEQAKAAAGGEGTAQYRDFARNVQQIMALRLTPQAAA